jgi:hypothetical protein
MLNYLFVCGAVPGSRKVLGFCPIPHQEETDQIENTSFLVIKQCDA